MSQPLLSIGMIVKNEERCLENCLKALEPLRQAIPCELVIADTGSTDKTKEIASKYADILFDFEWVNDFSKARNAVMDKCNGEWHLAVDADEYLSSPISEIVEFLTSPLAKKNVHAAIIQRNFKSPNMSGDYFDFNAIRMVRLDSGNRYTGIIHEAFPFIEIPTTHILRNTIFDHDGYAEISPNHLKKKLKRNLELLESELKNEPENIRRVLQCLESCGTDIDKRRYYTNYAKDLLKKANPNDPHIALCGAPCAKEALNFMIIDRHPDTSDFLNWVLQNFTDDYHILLDVRYIYIKRLYSDENFDECAKYCHDYLEAFQNYENRDNAPRVDDFCSPIIYTQPQHKIEIQTILANALIKLNREQEAITYLNRIDLSKTDKTSEINWFSAIINTENSELFAETAQTVIGNLFRKYHSQELKSNDPYDIAIATISKTFSCNPKREQDYNVFKSVPGTIGLSVNIANTETKEKVEEFLSKIEIWEEFMPLALANVIKLNAKLPKEFYLMNSIHLTYLTHDLIQNIPQYIKPLLNYCAITENSKLYETSFSFNLISTLLVNDNFDRLDTLEKENSINAFLNVSENYLKRCYNKELLENEELMLCVPAIHLFAWYLIKVNNIKNTDTLGYIKTLKTLLKKIPQAKQTTDFLIEKFKNDEEQKRQEKIKNASPELVAMAEQLKAMLTAFPENSPELLAIKQSPMYKQVAFLIEN